MFIGFGLAFALRSSNERMGPDCSPPDLCASGLAARLIEISAQPGPGFFPFVLGLLLASMGLVVLFRSLVFESEGGAPIGAIAWRPLVVVIAVVCLFGATLEGLGFVLASLLLIAAVALAGPVGATARWRRLAWQAGAIVLSAWLLFVPLLGFAFPLWPWFLR